jgi:ppGpp synthetase/RelA/SpoT-type nucleotidyltranferase
MNGLVNAGCPGAGNARNPLRCQQPPGTRDTLALGNRDKVSDDPTRFGYQSTHYLVKYLNTRTMMPEYTRFRNLIAEIQVRTILQHAWAEIEHDIQYKSSSVLPRTIR